MTMRMMTFTVIMVLGGETDEEFARHHWMIDSGCTDHLSPFKDDFAHLGNQV
jgi:hypothetical protein